MTISRTALLATTTSLLTSACLADAAHASPPGHTIPGDSTAASSSQLQEERGTGDSIDVASKALIDVATGGASSDADDPTGAFRALDKLRAQALRQRQASATSSRYHVPPSMAEDDAANGRIRDKAAEGHLGDGIDRDAESSSSCAADANFDGTVDWEDLLIVLTYYGEDLSSDDEKSPGNELGNHEPTGAVIARYQPGDITFDGRVDFDDLLAVFVAWGDCD